jgi:hypothetical protein
MLILPCLAVFLLLFHWLKQTITYEWFCSRSFFNLDNENGVEDTPRLIDRKVSFDRPKLFVLYIAEECIICYVPICKGILVMWICCDFDPGQRFYNVQSKIQVPCTAARFKVSIAFVREVLRSIIFWKYLTYFFLLGASLLNRYICRLISDLVVVIVSATCGGIAFACAGQPVITGYLLAGSIIGPGGLSFVSEMVQVAYISFSTSKFIFFFFFIYVCMFSWLPDCLGQGLDL